MSEETQESLIGIGPIQAWEVPFRRAVGSILQVALIAARNGLVKDAEAILAEVEAARPEHDSPKYARALVLLYSRKPEETIAFLKKQFGDAERMDDMARVITCLALHALNRIPECEESLRDLFRTGTNEQALGIGRTLAQDISLQT